MKICQWNSFLSKNAVLNRIKMCLVRMCLRCGWQPFRGPGALQPCSMIGSSWEGSEMEVWQGARCCYASALRKTSNHFAFPQCRKWDLTYSASDSRLVKSSCCLWCTSSLRCRTAGVASQKPGVDLVVTPSSFKPCFWPTRPWNNQAKIHWVFMWDRDHTDFFS